MEDTTRGVGEARTTSSGRRNQAPRGASSPSKRSTKETVDASDEQLDRDTEMRTRELESEIADTREELSETVEALQEKLRPSNIVAESTQAVKTAATERARYMVDSASRMAEDFVEGTRQNPLPALMIGAGVAWLLIDRSRNGRSWDRNAGHTAGTPYRSAEMDVSQGISSRASGTIGSPGPSVRRIARGARSGWQRMLHENPLLVAAAAVLAGAAVGGVLPQTEQENTLLGEARDKVVDRAQGVAREAADSVRDVATAVQQVAGRVNEPQG